MSNDTHSKQTLTCQDTNDRAHWAARLNAADQALCLSLISDMLDLWERLDKKGAPSMGAGARSVEGMKLYRERFGVEFVPF